MTSWPANPGWHPQFDNPDIRGWSVVASYVIAAVFCARAALARCALEREEKRDSALWWLFALGLLFSGINKQLNLQTLLIVLGRRAALALGWYDRAHMVQVRLFQVIFSLALVVAGVTAVWFLLVRFRRIFARNRWAIVGVLVLLLFVLIRAASINHVLERAKIKGDDKKWTWVLEIGGSSCLALAAIKAQEKNGCTG
jgi:uncharacterized membrane protein